MDILDQISSASSVHFKKVANSKGGVWKGPCPWCGGTDRFSIYPFDDEGSYICNQCKHYGDPIQFERDFNGLSFLEAVQKLGAEYKLREEKPDQKRTKPIKRPWEPRRIDEPAQAWMRRAEGLSFEAYKYLLSAHGKAYRNYLNSRGISNETIKKARIGYNPEAVQYSFSSFGLPAEVDQAGKEKQVWIPAGFIIPYFDRSGRIRRLRIRNAEKEAKGSRYILLTGGTTEYFIYPNAVEGRETIIVEAELDGWAIWNAAGDIINIIGVGNTTARPDEKAYQILSKAKQVFCAFDSDQAGDLEAGWWAKHLRAKRWKVPRGKDPGEAIKAGVDLRRWIEEALQGADKPSQDVVQYQYPEPAPENTIPACRPEKEKHGDAGASAYTTEKALSKKRGDHPIECPLDLLAEAEPDRSLQEKPLKITVKTLSEITVCRDLEPCIHLSGGRCLRSMEYVFHTEVCPRERWAMWVEDENISQIIKMPAKSRKKQ